MQINDVSGTTEWGHDFTSECSVALNDILYNLGGGACLVILCHCTCLNFRYYIISW